MNIYQLQNPVLWGKEYSLQALSHLRPGSTGSSNMHYGAIPADQIFSLDSSNFFDGQTLGPSTMNFVSAPSADFIFHSESAENPNFQTGLQTLFNSPAFKVSFGETNTHEPFPMDFHGFFDQSRSALDQNMLQSFQAPIEFSTLSSDVISVNSSDSTVEQTTSIVNLISPAPSENSVPVISGASTGSLSEEAVNISGQLNISDADTGQSSFEAETLTGSYGSLSIGTDGSWVYSLNNDSSAVQSLGSGSSLTDIISVTTADGSHQNITVTINGTNDAPTCSFDTVTTTENASVTIDALANIQDVDSPLSTLSITFASILGPESGSVSVVDNQLVFDPGSDFDDLGPNQTESVLINYMVSDGENSSVSSVMVTVTGQNDAPIVVNDAASVMEDRVLTFDVLANDLDVDQGDHLTLTHAEINGGLHQGAVSIVDNQIVYDPQGNFDALNDGQTQSITISYSLQDDSGVTASGTLVITVNGENNGITVNASNGDNTVMGGNYDDTLYGNGGVDHISGLGGDDYISGGTGGDYLYGGEGNDYIDGGIGSDYIEGGAGADTIMGGTYTDTALYTNSSQGVQVSLTTGLGHGGDAEGDTLSSIENLTGSSHDDIFWGNTSNNVIRGAEGNDLYHYSAGQGADTFSGGAGSDTIQLDGVTGSPGAGAWNLSVGSGVTYTIDAVHHTLDFSSSASGSLSLVGGGSVSFDGIEKISWG